MSRQRDVRRKQRSAELAQARVEAGRSAGRYRRTRSTTVAGGVVVLVALVVGIWLVRPKEQTVALEKTYRGDACLLTGPAGVNPPTSAAVWQGVRTGAAKRTARASFFTVPGNQNRANTESMLNSLVQRKCSVIVAVDPAPTSTVLARAAQHPDITFVVVGATTSPQANVVAVTVGDKAVLTSNVATDVQAHIRV